MKVPIIMTPGPTMVRENVRLARAEIVTNPDIDLQFYDFYRDTCRKIGEFLKTENEVRILSGEGILGLEAACASLTEKNDRVLILDNGIFGEGFGDFVKLYGGEAVYFKGDRRKKLDVQKIKEFLDKDSNFKYATIVHCDTPSGVLNEIDKICPILKEKGIITVVDSVAAMGGEELKVDDWYIDIVIGASQKCISAPPGLTVISISEDAFRAMENRKMPIASFYCNILSWRNYYENKWFPYTPPISDIVGLRKAIENIIDDEKILERHSIIARATRTAIIEAGLELYTYNGYSSTVTVLNVPDSVDDKKLRKYMIDNFNVMIAGSFEYLEGKVLRIGHMGENAKIQNVAYTLAALNNTFNHYGINLKGNMAEIFLRQLKKQGVVVP